jgi:hypothetical protein
VKILDGLSVSLTNDNASIPARSTGFIESGSFVLSSGSVSVKVGNEIIVHSNGLSANNRFDVVSAVATNVQTGSLTYSTTDYFISRLDADSGSLNLTIRYKDGAGDTSDTTKLVTYTKNKKAAPVLQISSTPKDQTVTAKSTGEQIDTFANVTISVKQTYDGATTNLTITSLTATSTNISSISTTPSTGLVTLNGKTLANGVNSTTVDISAVVTDSEGVSRTITDTLSLSKTKKAVPNVVISATPQAQSILANAAGVQTGTLTNVTVTALEGTTSRFTSMTGTYAGFSTNPTITGNQLNMTGSIMNVAEASATIVATHTDSEGTTGQTQTIVVRFTKVNTGTAGSNGGDGGAGPGVVYRGDWAPNTSYFSSSIRVDVVRGSDSEYWLAKVGHTSTAAGTLDKPITGTSYATYWRPFGATFESVATDILLARDATITRGLVMGTYGATDKGFIRSANATALMSGKGYYLDTTGSMRFGDPSGAYIKFTESEGVTIAGSVSISGTATIGGTSATTVKDGAASGATAQQNNSAKTDGSVGGWTVDSNAIWSGTKDTSGYSTTGITLNSGGSIHAPNFYIDTAGSASFRGTISAGSGDIGGWLINSASLSKGTISLNSQIEQIQVGTGNGRVLINTTTFNDRFDPTDTAKSISIGPGGIILKGAHTSGTPQSYIYLLQEGDAARQVITSTNLGVEPLAVYGHPTGGSSAAVVVYNGGLQARNFAFTAGGTAYPGTGNGGYAIKSVGNFYTEGTGTFTGDVTANTSDRRLKTNIKNIDSPLEKISKINGVYFNWNEKAKELITKDTEKREVGLIAQEIEDVLPEIIKPAPFDVTIDENVTDRVMYKSKSGENYLTIQYEKIVPLLVECIKELKLEIEELKKNK